MDVEVRAVSVRRITTPHTSVSDFDPMCDCGNKAVVFMEIHNAHQSHETGPTLSKLLCRPCTKRDLDRVLTVLMDGPVQCKTCDLRIVTLSDMVVRLCPLWAVGNQ